MAKATKYVYSFGGGKAEGKAGMKQLLGGKGANLAEMSSIGVPVPAGFTITTEVCAYYYKHGQSKPADLEDQITEGIAKMEKAMGATFGDPSNPLLVSVRSGAAVSMPGMMDTVLNLGINDEVVAGLIAKTGNDRMGWDSYRRFINMFGDVCMGVHHEHFEDELSRIKKKYKRELDTDLTVDELKEVVDAYKKVYKKHVGDNFPTDAREQLTHAVDAVLGSWNSARAISYRKINKFDDLQGTAVNVQAMVFGNMGDSSGTGVAFTRDPNNGEDVFFGEFLVNAQGEDVVAGIRTPMPIEQMKKLWPSIYKELDDIRVKLEKHYKEMQDVEFTIQEGKLYMLQTRTGKRAGLAAVQIAVDMVKEKLISDKEGLNRIQGDHLNQLLFPILDPKEKSAAAKKGNIVAKGLPAGPGAASGKVVFNAEDAEKWAAKGEKVILVRKETSPEDVSGMWAAQAILTSTGGVTSHAAVVARGWGKCCVAGCGALEIDYKKKTIKVAGKTIKEGDMISLDGSSGEVIIGHIPTSASPVVAGVIEGKKKALEHPICKIFQEVMKWSDKYRKINVRTNAESPNDSKNARAFGAEGIGLCRTEHMFFEGDRIWAMREMILADNEAGRKAALKKLLPYQRKDFEGIFKAMDGFPVTVRLLDPPLHEFLPHDAAGQKEMAKRLDVSPNVVKSKVEALHEMNPMLGHRGCRLSITYPEICEMQAQAIIEAACNATKKGIKVLPEIMIPLIGTKAEFDLLEKVVRKTATEVMEKKKIQVKYLVGTMMEIPRATLVADEVAEKAEFFSFGTNDLTQMTFGYSRDDVGGFLPDYIDQKVITNDPFASIDQVGVGSLVQTGVTKGRQTRKDLKCGVCGEHGGDPDSVKFFVKSGLNYVSCSPFRVPIARLAAAQAATE